ncbi:MAG: LamG domain-containing protein [Chitinispirillia bacterium]|nr:LamG domain-containing protein [Chitinispirillia bacterium]MCL2241270.1 LamG domain-containing protein [Chitinispirillia bacterium]
MRKTTDPKERKYLADREFNTFGRGAIEDAPAELLYGKGAIAQGFNVNCFKGYVEGRAGSKLFSTAKTPIALSMANEHGPVDGTVYKPPPMPSDAQDPRRIMFGPYLPSLFERIRYVEWPDGDRDVITRIIGSAPPQKGFVVQAESGHPHGPALLSSIKLRTAPDIMVWHNEFQIWVRLESGQLNTSPWNIPEWARVYPLDDMANSPFSCGRSAFIEDRTGGFIYNRRDDLVWWRRTGGIFRWIADEGVVFRVNNDAPVQRPQSPAQGAEIAHEYRYLITGLRMRGKSRFDGGVVDYETPPQDAYGVHFNSSPIGKDRTAQLVLTPQPDVDTRTVTHLGVYRTLDLRADPRIVDGTEMFNMSDEYALVADIPLTPVIMGRLEGNTLTVTQGALPPWSKKMYLKFGDSAAFGLSDVAPDGKSATIDSIDNPGNVSGDGAIAAGWAQIVVAANVVTEAGDTLRIDHNTSVFEGRAEDLLGRPVFLSDGEAYSVVSITRAPYTGALMVKLSRRVVGIGGAVQYAAAFMVGIPSAFTDNLPDEISDSAPEAPALRPRLHTWTLNTMYRKPLPDCNIAAAIPGFVVCAVSGESKLYHTQADEMHGPEYWGSHNPLQTNTQMADGIEHVEVFPDVVAVFGAKTTWQFLAGSSSDTVPPMLPSINIVDYTIGCKEYRSIRRISGAEVILVTREAETPGVRIFNGHRYSDNLLVDNTLGMSRNKNRMRATRETVAVYGEEIGYIAWRAEIEDGGAENEHLKTLTSYCFRLAVRGGQGGGQTEYGGERWLWPDAGAASVASGYDPDGQRLILIEDARTGNFYRIGLAEVWADREGENGGEGYDIPTAITLPAIADGYKWQRHLETHIAMRPWMTTYRGIRGFTMDGFKIAHQASLKIFEDGEVVAEASALRDINRNGDYAYLQKIDARRIQERIETTTSAYKISQVVTKVQTSDREALPGNNEASTVKYQREWRRALVLLSRNRPYPAYNRADGNDATGGPIHKADGPFGRVGEAFWPENYAGIPAAWRLTLNFTLSMWVRPLESGRLFMASGGFPIPPSRGFGLELEYDRPSGRVRFTRGAVILEAPVQRGEWAHIAIVTGFGRVSLYINGHQSSTTSRRFRLAMGEMRIGDGRRSEMFDVRVVWAAVSPESIQAYIDAVSRGGEGWLP